MKILQIILLFAAICFWNCSKDYEMWYKFRIINNTTSSIILEYKPNNNIRSTDLSKNEFKKFRKVFYSDHEISQTDLDTLIGYIKVIRNDSLKYIQDPINLDLWELLYNKIETDVFIHAESSSYRFYITDSLLALTD